MIHSSELFKAANADLRSSSSRRFGASSKRRSSMHNGAGQITTVPGRYIDPNKLAKLLDSKFGTKNYKVEVKSLLVPFLSLN